MFSWSLDRMVIRSDGRSNGLPVDRTTHIVEKMRGLPDRMAIRSGCHLSKVYDPWNQVALRSDGNPIELPLDSSADILVVLVERLLDRMAVRSGSHSVRPPSFDGLPAD